MAATLQALFSSVIWPGLKTSASTKTSGATDTLNLRLVASQAGGSTRHSVRTSDIAHAALFTKGTCDASECTVADDKGRVTWTRRCGSEDMAGGNGESDDQFPDNTQHVVSNAGRDCPVKL